MPSLPNVPSSKKGAQRKLEGLSRDPRSAREPQGVQVERADGANLPVAWDVDLNRPECRHRGCSNNRPVRLPNDPRHSGLFHPSRGFPRAASGHKFLAIGG
ncbi:MAG: hypothetical protein QOG21_123 [Actinomycetota bacterium]|nr:hypothetical protein [Actinomycetota bacterium]